MLNLSIVTGRLVADPELKQTESGVAYTRFTLAVERARTDKNGERAVDFIDIMAWRETADFVCRNFHKGRAISVSGPIYTHSYVDGKGVKRHIFRINAQEVYFADYTPKARDSLDSREHPEEESQEAVQEEVSPEDEDAFAFLDEDLPF